MQSEEYLTQHFPPRPSQNGSTENTNAYNARLYWFKHNYPKYKEVAEAFGYTEGRVNNYANKYNWKQIRATYEELCEREELEQYKKDARRMEKKQNTANELMFNRNIKRMEHLLHILNELPNNPATKKLTKEEEKEARQELETIENKIIKLQPNIRTSYHLTNHYNDKQVTEHQGEVELQHNTKKSVGEVLKENESEIRKFIRRTTGKEDKPID